MRILHVTNIISPHQLPLAHELLKAVGKDNYRMAVTHPVDVERIRLGWDAEYSKPWILNTSQSIADKVQFDSWWDCADIVICGERFFEKMTDRILKKKLCFYMSERWWKPPLGLARLLHPRFAAMVFNFKQICTSPFFHYLAIGPYAAKDIKQISSMHENIWSWGYFTKKLSHENIGDKSNSDIKILWAGRMIKLKRVDLLIKAFSELQKKHHKSKLTLIGDGPERIELEKLAANLLIDGSYKFFDPVPSDQILNFMENHDVYAFPSNSYEGWGAVINEAMGTGCIVVSSKSTGAGAAMIEDGLNGLLFESGNSKELHSCLDRIASDKELRVRIAKNAQLTISEIWSPSNAATRLLAVSEALIFEKDVPIYHSGPMSRIW